MTGDTEIMNCSLDKLDPVGFPIHTQTHANNCKHSDINMSVVIINLNIHNTYNDLKGDLKFCHPQTGSFSTSQLLNFECPRQFH